MGFGRRPSVWFFFPSDTFIDIPGTAPTSKLPGGRGLGGEMGCPFVLRGALEGEVAIHPVSSIPNAEDASVSKTFSKSGLWNPLSFAYVM